MRNVTIKKDGRCNRRTPRRDSHHRNRKHGNQPKRLDRPTADRPNHFEHSRRRSNTCPPRPGQEKQETPHNDPPGHDPGNALYYPPKPQLHSLRKLALAHEQYGQIRIRDSNIPLSNTLNARTTDQMLKRNRYKPTEEHTPGQPRASILATDKPKRLAYTTSCAKLENEKGHHTADVTNEVTNAGAKTLPHHLESNGKKKEASRNDAKSHIASLPDSTRDGDHHHSIGHRDEREPACIHRAD